MGLWAGGLGDWAKGGRWGEVALPTIGETGLGCRVGSFWAMVSTAFGKSGVLIRVGQKRDPEVGYGRRVGGAMGGKVDGWVRGSSCGGGMVFSGNRGLGCCWGKRAASN